MDRDAIVLCDAVRTPIGKFLGALQTVPAVELGVTLVAALLERTGATADDIDQVYFGMARQAGEGANPARQISFRAGIPETATAMTVNQACASGMRAITLAAQEIAGGNARAVIAGGVETMSRNPFMLTGMRNGYRLGHGKVLDGNYADGFHCRLVDGPMGSTAENLAERYEISREEQDAFAVESQRKAQAAQEAGRFADEIVPVTVKSRRGEVVVDTDEHPRHGASMEGQAKLKAVFREGGGVTAGNSSGITDGAAAVLVTSAGHAADKGWPVLARLTDHAMVGVDPHIMGIGPVPVTRTLLERGGLTLDDLDLIELNEAFAAQVIACDRELQLDPAKLNVNGGSIALGHPIGATGARIVVTLLHEMKRRDAKRGLATLCVSGGQGIGAVFER
ncbi:MAG: acetyl-CoA C-acyltransferase [Planctomycetota bacterium]|nr:MAG: acetyl-CoA C-acyltransferase [Planctomycetota bacterium]